MNKEQINELIMGVAVVALGYALWKNFRPGAAAQVATKAGAPSPFTGMTDLLTGTVNDTGAFEGVNYLAQIESAAPVYGNGPRVAGRYW
jgi:hypothetical protein